ncbi:FUSC family protein [Streptomyces hydrogenans]|uniref:FUSC family protein n=1 Tax=Streptomyces hydrogenans TaxID=1873719 RepID=UPI00333173C6
MRRPSLHRAARARSLRGVLSPRGALALQRADDALPFALRAALVTALAALPPFLTGRPGDAVFAMLGSFTTTFGRPLPHARRTRVLAGVAAAMTLCVAAGSALGARLRPQDGGAGALLVVAATALVAGTAKLACDRARLGGLGAVMLLFGFAVAAHAAPTPAEVLPRTLLAAGGAATAWLAAFAGRLARPEGPRRHAVALALHEVAALLDAEAAGTPRTAARHRATAAVLDAYRALEAERQPTRPGSRRTAGVRETAVTRRTHGLTSSARACARAARAARAACARAASVRVAFAHAFVRVPSARPAFVRAFVRAASVRAFARPAFARPAFARPAFARAASVRPRRIPGRPDRAGTRRPPASPEHAERMVDLCWSVLVAAGRRRPSYGDPAGLAGVLRAHARALVRRRPGDSPALPPAAEVNRPHGARPPAPALFVPALRTVLGTGLAGAVALGLGLGHGYWAALSAAAVLHSVDVRTATRRAVQRTLGTAAGLVLAVAVLGLRPGPLALAGTVVALELLLEYAVARNYGLGVVFLTPLALLLTELAAPAERAGALVLDRAAGSLLGILLALLCALAVVHDRAAVRARRALAACVLASAQAREALAAGRAGAAPEVLQARLAVAVVELREAEDAAAGELWPAGTDPADLARAERRAYRLLGLLASAGREGARTAPGTGPGPVSLPGAPPSLSPSARSRP